MLGLSATSASVTTPSWSLPHLQSQRFGGQLAQLPSFVPLHVLVPWPDSDAPPVFSPAPLISFSIHCPSNVPYPTGSVTTVCVQEGDVCLHDSGSLTSSLRGIFLCEHF